MSPIEVLAESTEAKDFIVFIPVERFIESARIARTTFNAVFWFNTRNPITTGETETLRHPLHLQFRKN